MRDDLVTRSKMIIREGQALSGAYVACPRYPTYNYGWFRDGAFIATAMDTWGEHADTARFYSWACSLIAARGAAVERCVEAAAQDAAPNPADLLHTRYTLDGQPGSEAWPNFQLDGFGTLLWGIEQHLTMIRAPLATAPAPWQRTVRLLVRYLAALWRWPNYDCWEEFPDDIAVSTLAAIYAGLHAAATLLGRDDSDGALAADTAGAVHAFTLVHGVRDGHLIKQIDGEDVVDASLLWAAVPFGVHAMLPASDPLMLATAERISGDLVGRTGGVHRYRADTFYGGGEWTLLAALLGQYAIAIGDRVTAEHYRAWVAAQAVEQFWLPEQISIAPIAPERVTGWVERWGPVACPLLWSHANYLTLVATLQAPAPAG